MNKKITFDSDGSSSAEFFIKYCKGIVTSQYSSDVPYLAFIMTNPLHCISVSFDLDAPDSILLHAYSASCFLCNISASNSSSLTFNFSFFIFSNFDFINHLCSSP
eukprot:NODE_407_length_9242_cov_0.441868.p8 type:complete len:105 gc:universal NODE_407_length_9242_cov_0.441868:8799-8485(-)